MGTLIGYVEQYGLFIYKTNGNAEILIEGFVQDLGLAKYEFRIIDCALFIFELIDKTRDGEKELVLVSNNYSIIRKNIRK